MSRVAAWSPCRLPQAYHTAFVPALELVRCDPTEVPPRPSTHSWEQASVAYDGLPRDNARTRRDTTQTFRSILVRVVHRAHKAISVVASSTPSLSM